jgi:hypothetical protein
MNPSAPVTTAVFFISFLGKFPVPVRKIRVANHEDRNSRSGGIPNLLLNLSNSTAGVKHPARSIHVTENTSAVCIMLNSKLSRLHNLWWEARTPEV